MLLPVVPCLVNKGTTLPFMPCQVRPATVEGGLCAGGNYRCFEDGNTSVQGKRLAILLFVHVDGKGGGSVDTGVEFCHVVIDFRLGDSGIGGANVGDKVMK